MAHMMSSMVASPMITSRTAVRSQASRASLVVRAEAIKPVMIGLAADSGCGKSTFMRRVTQVFGGEPKPPAGGNPDSNTLLSDLTTVICLDDYHAHDLRAARISRSPRFARRPRRSTSWPST